MILKITKIFLKASWKDKKEIIKYFYNNAKKRFIDYWLGSVDVYGQDILTNDGNKLYTYSIIAGQYGKGVWFSDLDAQGIFDVIEKVKAAQGKKFNLYVNYGGGCYNEYTFNKRLTRILLDKLTKLSKREIYKEEK